MRKREGPRPRTARKGAGSRPGDTALWHRHLVPLTRSLLACPTAIMPAALPGSACFSTLRGGCPSVLQTVKFSKNTRHVNHYPVHLHLPTQKPASPPQPLPGEGRGELPPLAACTCVPHNSGREPLPATQMIKPQRDRATYSTPRSKQTAGLGPTCSRPASQGPRESGCAGPGTATE